MKYLIKKTCFIFLEWIFVNHLFRYLNRGKIKVLLYHNIIDSRLFFKNAISKKSFIKQLKYLNKYYNIVTLSQDGTWIGLSKKKVNILITFDDGFINNYEVAMPILLDFGINAYFFLISDCVEEGVVPCFIKRQYPNHDCIPEFRTVNKIQVKEMLQKGMNIGSHTISHNDLSKFSITEAVYDADKSKKYLKTILENNVESFAFPWGFYKEEQLPSIKKIFRRIFTVKHGFNLKDDHILHRNEVDEDYQMFATASGLLDFLKCLFQQKN